MIDISCPFPRAQGDRLGASLGLGAGSSLDFMSLLEVSDMKLRSQPAVCAGWCKS